ncbi:F-box domain, cyclin-like protein [Artemisia annua]|uniref:F-box domain, cyclin-like protein n=1 Tax=Artemisia annua TaxID=35608 RepID=A0A2U1N5T2_ARTAN|nr:F-box domain, cyclin-like protein [Artemisia annua]
MEDAYETIKMLQELRTAKILTLGLNIVESISSFRELLSLHPSPFCNLVSLIIDSSMRKDACKVNMSVEARNFLLENSPSATFIMKI